MAVSQALHQHLLVYQRNEITEHHIYKQLAKTIKSPENSHVLGKIADDETSRSSSGFSRWRA